MNKLEMAHDYLIKLIEVAPDESTKSELVSVAWDYADLMKAEADKRGANIPKPVLTNADKKKVDDLISRSMLMSHSHVVDGVEQENAWSSEEWQPDWSQAPEWANWWVIGSLTKQGIWSEAKPNSVKINGVDYWEVTSPSGDEHLSVSPSFNYQGDWRNSLRKRPK